MADEYPVPSASPLVDITQWRGLLLAAIDVALDRVDVWADGDVDTALGYVQDLKLWASLLGGGVITDIRTVNGQIEVQRDGGGSWAAVTDANYVRADGSVAMTGELTINPAAEDGLLIQRSGDFPVAVRLKNGLATDVDWSIFLETATGMLGIRNRSTNNVNFKIAKGANPTQVFVDVDRLRLSITSTNTLSAPVVIQRERYGATTPQAGYGLSDTWRANCASPTLGGAQQQMGITSRWDDPVEATRKGGGDLKANDVTAGRVIFVWGTNGSAGMLGFLGAAKQLRQVITGSRGGNAALADLLTKMALIGLITDSTTA